MDMHRCRFVPFPPSAINALAFSQPSGSDRPGQSLKLAVGRANADIELWVPKNGEWVLERTFYGGRGRTVEGLVWTTDPDEVAKDGRTIHGKLRLFSIGFSNAVTEWDLVTGLPIRQSSGNYSEVWSIAAQPRFPSKRKKTIKTTDTNDSEIETQSQDLVVGCRDGSLVLLSTADDSLIFKKYLSKESRANARALCISFQDRNTVVAGYADSCIRVYDIRNGELRQTMTVGRGSRRRNQGAHIWAIQCLKDGTIVSGDSFGQVCFWDAETYGLLQRIQSHEADTLCLAASPDGQIIFSGGVDRRTVVYMMNEAERSRKEWAKVGNSRHHQHDVKAMAIFENEKFSMVVSGGHDATPIVAPLRQHGKEFHRALPYIPQIPRTASAKRLLVSWWNNEVNIYRISRKQTQSGLKDDDEQPNFRTIAQIVLTGEENITSVDISACGRIIAVSTVSETKLFRMIVRSDAKGKRTKIRKIETNALPGSHIVRFSPNTKWLVMIGTGNEVRLARLIHDSEGKDVSIIGRIVPLKRMSNRSLIRNSLNGNWGSYDRHISRLAFSAESNLLAVCDLAGYLDTWVLEGHEDLTAPEFDQLSHTESDHDADSASESDDDDDDEPVSQRLIFYGQHWVRNPNARLLPRLPSSALVLSFRPYAKSAKLPADQLMGNPAVHPTRNNPHAHAHTIPTTTEDRLFVLTSGHQLYEFEVLKGSLTEWSRRNPTHTLPEEFRIQRDRAMGCVWDIQASTSDLDARERIWLYSTTWLFMFDLNKDFGSQTSPAERASNGTNSRYQEYVLMHNEKRKLEARDQLLTKRHTGGAGSKMPDDRLQSGVGARKMRKLDADGAVEWMDVDDGEVNNNKKRAKRHDEEDNEDGDEIMGESSSSSSSEDDNQDSTSSTALHHLRRRTDAANATTDATNGNDETNADSESKEPNGDSSLSHAELTSTSTSMSKAASAFSTRPSYYINQRYRPILGIVPLYEDAEDDDADAYNQLTAEYTTITTQSTQGHQPLEVALVERPPWDLTLPPKFVGARGK